MIEKSNLFNQLQQHEGKVTESPLVTKLLEPEVLPSISGGNYA
ncbi:hypothetical protein [Pseudoalteromonas piscicida]|nr:hypothetical protein [Pseudoalteromonas piscicida]